jgi:hypothetical protein
MNTDPKTIAWLLEGDPAIHWQVMRDLLNEPPEIFEGERAKVATVGWGKQLLGHQDSDGNWGGGIYTPKWKSTTYTMLLLHQLGLPIDNPQAQQACSHLVDGVYSDGGINYWKSLKHSETCVSGMVLALLSYFRYPDERVHRLANHLLEQQMADGGWNCKSYDGATHSSFHTTISVLEGLQEYASSHPTPATIMDAAQRGREFLLAHRLYKSHRTGTIVDTAMKQLHFPPRWRYDFIRALDYFQSVNAAKDERIQDAIDLLKEKQNDNGRWILNKPWSGVVFFDMEQTGKESRWNTLRALRVLKWWEK